ncbi:MAG: CHAT domain-containing protein [Candidatus Binataceae bacterium]
MKATESASIIAPASELLPSEYQAEEIRSVLSSDGQVYAELPDGRGEARVECWEVRSRLEDRRDAEKSEADTATKGKGRALKRRLRSTFIDRPGDWRQRIVRHLIHEVWRCRDCSHEMKAVHFVWVERRCARCWSTELDIVERELIPNQPVRLANIGEIHFSWTKEEIEKKLRKHIWGRVPDRDVIMLGALQGSYLHEPEDFREPEKRRYLYLLWQFGDSLLGLPQYAQSPETCNLILKVAYLVLEYFQISGSPLAARRTLEYFERASASVRDPGSLAVTKQGFAMAAFGVLDRYDETQAERITGRAGLWQLAITCLHDSLALLPRATDMERDWLRHQRAQIRYTLALLLRSGRCNPDERAEAVKFFDSLPAHKLGPLESVYVRSSRALAQLLIPVPQHLTKKQSDRAAADEEIEPWFQATDELAKILRATENVAIFRYRWRLALAVGEFFLRMGGFDIRLADSFASTKLFLESAATFILKDAKFQSDPITVGSDAELYQEAFNALAGMYTTLGSAFAALSLLETYRGRAIASVFLTPRERRDREAETWTRQIEDFHLMSSPDDSASLILADEAATEMLTGTTDRFRTFGAFGENYELKGLEKRLRELFKTLADEETVLVSIWFNEVVVRGMHGLSAILLGPKFEWQCKSWFMSGEDRERFASDLYRRVGSFRESRLQQLGESVFKHLLKPLEPHLRSFRCRRALLVMPSLFSNLPIEAYRYPAKDKPSKLPTRHFAFTPSLMFGQLQKRKKRNRSRDKLLIVGYFGTDLEEAAREAEFLRDLFGTRCSYIPGRDCTKRRVIEELNGGYNYVHFIAHGEYDAVSPRESYVSFRSEEKDAYRLRARELREFVRLRKHPVVTLSACSTALTADSRSNTWHGFPGSLLEVGAHCIIGTRWPIADRVSSEFMPEFYRQLVNTEDSPLRCFHRVQDSWRQRARIEEWACFGYLGAP